jgi:hypothetical protein
MSEKIFHNRRDWLNPKGHWDTGAMASRVSADEDGVECNISIWDCGRKISLDMGIYNEKAAIQRSKKIQLMIDHLQGVQASLGEAYSHFMFEKEKT